MTPVREIIKTTLLGDIDVVFANSAAANTVGTGTVQYTVSTASEYKLVVYNPSTVTDLTVKVKCVQEALKGSNRDSLLTTLTFPKGDTTEQLIHGIDGIVKFICSNATILGGSDGFTATVRLIEM